MAPEKRVDVETKLGSAGHEEDDNGFMWVANNTCCIRHSNEGTGENRPQVVSGLPVTCWAWVGRKEEQIFQVG